MPIIRYRQVHLHRSHKIEISKIYTLNAEFFFGEGGWWFKTLYYPCAAIFLVNKKKGGF